GFLDDEDRVVEALFTFELEANPAGVDSGASVLRQPILMRRLPAAVEEVVGRQPQAVAAMWVCGRVVSLEPGDVGVEARPADHPGPPVDDPGVPLVGARVRSPIAPLLVERPEGQELRGGRTRQASVR